MLVLAHVFGPNVSQLTIGLDIVDADSSFPRKHLDEKVP